MTPAVAELKDLASDSLNLLKAAIYDERFPALFDLEVYGSIVGMFELNNLGGQLLTCLEPEPEAGVCSCLGLCVRHQKSVCLQRSSFVWLDWQCCVVQGHAGHEV